MPVSDPRPCSNHKNSLKEIDVGKLKLDTIEAKRNTPMLKGAYGALGLGSSGGWAGPPHLPVHP